MCFTLLEKHKPNYMYEPTGQEIASHQKGRYKTRKQLMWTIKMKNVNELSMFHLNLGK